MLVVKFYRLIIQAIAQPSRVCGPYMIDPHRQFNFTYVTRLKPVPQAYGPLTKAHLIHGIIA